MTGKYAYSFDQEDYRGAFDTREAALQAGLSALRDRSDMPEGVFVGQWAEPDIAADGHAECVIDAIRDRWNALEGDRAFLANLTEQQAADLDHHLATAVRNWLVKHALLPRPTEVRAVSHHAVPMVHHVASPQGERETSVIGEA
ncbi:MAG TPA: hypothetical protein VF624_16290 [Tepidisphaeraceae bacterium]|jgi:hypothetical protein